MLQTRLDLDRALDALKALGEPTRLRLVRLLSNGDLTVTDLVQILGQSQPRISRHLKLLVDSKILTRYQEGAWAYFRLSDDAGVAALVERLMEQIDGADPTLKRDAERLDDVRTDRAARAADYFAQNADSWDRIRLLHAPDADVERRLLDRIGEAPVERLLDIGTGTGRLLELLAGRCSRAIGIDASREMLQVARAKLEAGGIVNATVRLGDCYRLPVQRDAFDLVTLHQVLHHLADPVAALREAAAVLAPGGRLAVVDFAPHHLEFLRDHHAHLRLGFGAEALSAQLEEAGLEVLSVDRLGPAHPDPDRLTVTIWFARDRRAALASAPLDSIAVEKA
ncbi:ArsR family transcriptional regulator [Aureimonas sp. Leaf454]|uniref:ArsR/SmtB family transcription factor n=1 Tax=Aureimonas sp. Leaf454 TaxID=1736381 RepID=UPI0006F2D226|nr:metalloregulator ArsR/SmtB family transcription factor [Aureimonas sp. Leaf454]KQT50921.1 ArsR family transcriptional regulator [Aureimonas sp. Leaf454]